MIAYYKPLLIRLFSTVQHIHADPFGYSREYLDIQETLIKKISYVEGRIRRLKANIRESKRLLGSKMSGLNKEGSQNVKDRVSQYHARIDEYQELLTILRWIGDALAFSLFDRWDIKPMAVHREHAGFLSGKKGARRERIILRAMFRHGYIALLTDLTNCLRYGDIAVFDRKEGKWGIVEVKSGRKESPRALRQISEIQRILDYLHTDRTEKLFGTEKTIQRVPAHAKPNYNTDQLNEVLNEALVKKSSHKRVEDGLYYVAATQFDPEVLKEISRSCKGKMIAAVVDPQAYGDFGYYPLTLSIRNPEALYMLCAGELSIIIVLDMGVVKEKLKASEIRLEALTEGRDAGLVAQSVQPGDSQPEEMKIGKYFFNRVFTEFLSIDWFVQQIIASMQTDMTKLFAG
jgi:hypothetical protein